MEGNLQLPELRKIAKEKGLKNISKLKKEELIELLKSTEDNTIADKKQEEKVQEKTESKEEFISR